MESAPVRANSPRAAELRAEGEELSARLAEQRLPSEEEVREPAGLADGLTVVVGHAEDLGDADPLCLGHPPLETAVAEAREATDRRSFAS